MIEPRPQIASTPPATHGGPAGARDERMPVRIDFSTSLNAWGPARSVADAARAASVDAYPDPEQLAPRRAAAAWCGAPLETICFGAGAAELIFAVCFAFVRPDDAVLVPGPTFGEYARCAALCGARILSGSATSPDYALEPGAIVHAVAEHRPRLAFLCAPNNPTGQTFGRVEVALVADACQRAGTLLVLDQSYDAFLEEPLGTPALPAHPATLHLRSLTKDHALAGIRAAFAVGPVFIIRALERARVPWAVSTCAQAAAAVALSDVGEVHLAATVPRLRAERTRIEAALARLGIPTVPTATHFLLAEVGDASLTAGSLRRDHRIGVRDCTSFGLPGHIRIAARTPAENEHLLNALAAVCSN